MSTADPLAAAGAPSAPATLLARLGQVADVLRRNQAWLGLAALVALPVALRASDRPAYLTAAVLSLVIALAALSLVVLVGWVGQLSLAQFAFMGIGALAISRLAPHIGFWPSIPLAGLAAVPAGLVAAVPALRLRGIYLAVATLGFGQVVESALLLNPTIAGGEQLHVDPPRLGPLTFPGNLDGRFRLYFVVLVVLCAFIAFTQALRRRRTGRAFLAIRDSEVAAASVGIDVVAWKLVAFGLAAFYAGVAGALFMLLNNDVAPDTFDSLRGSIPLLIVLVIAGITSVQGAVLAGFLFAMAPLVMPSAIDSVLHAVHAPIAFNPDLVYAVFGAGLLIGLVLSPQRISATFQTLVAASPASQESRRRLAPPTFQDAETTREVH